MRLTTPRTNRRDAHLSCSSEPVVPFAERRQIRRTVDCSERNRCKYYWYLVLSTDLIRFEILCIFSRRHVWRTCALPDPSFYAGSPLPNQYNFIPDSEHMTLRCMNVLNYNRLLDTVQRENLRKDSFGVVESGHSGMRL